MSDSQALMRLRDVNGVRLMPDSIAADPSIAANLHALDGFWKHLAEAVPTFGILATIHRQPEEVVDRLAWQFHVDYWDGAWPLEKKRTVIINSIRLHRIAGTRGAVNDVVSSIWGDMAIISEWWEYGGEPGTFVITLSTSQTQEAIDAFMRSIDFVKRATDRVTIASTIDAGQVPAYVGTAVYQWTNYNV